MRVFRHPSEDVLRVVIDDGEGDITEVDLRYDPPETAEVFDVPSDWPELT